MIAVVLVSETSLDFGAFMPSAQLVTGMNHVADADAHPGPTQLATNLKIIRDFAGRQMDMALYSLNVGFLVAGMPHDIIEIMEYCSDLSYVRTTLSLRSEVECVLITGNLAQWRDAVTEGCKAHPMSTAREAFNQVYMILNQKGLGELFSNKRTHESKDGTFLLEDLR